MSSTIADQETVYPNNYRSVKEGLVTIRTPIRDGNSVQNKQNQNKNHGDQTVFYNPIQQFNRDLSILAILVYGEGALLEKQTHLSRKQKHRRRGKLKRNLVEQSSDQDPSLFNTGHSNPRKRKAEGTELDEAGQSAKTSKDDEFEADEDELELLTAGENTAMLDENAVDQLDSSGLDGSNSHIQTEVESEAVANETVKKIPFTILDALSATGLRALRYAKEIPFTTNIIANDLSPEAVKSIEHNIDHNEVRHKVRSHIGDARAYMYSKAGNEHQQPSQGYVHRFDVIDLDPYGTAAPFLDAAVQALVDGGLLCVTCTDAGVFASNGYPEKAYALYNGVPMKGVHSHEGGLRLILNAVATVAARYGIAIEPLLSLSIDFYARLFIRIHKQPKDVKLLAGTTMMVYNCDYGCGAWTTQLIARNQCKENKIGQKFFKHSYAQAPSSKQFCDHCTSKMHICGPLWAGPLHNPYFIQRILDKLPSIDKKVYATHDRIRGMLTVALEEDLTLDISNIFSSDTNLPPEANINSSEFNSDSDIKNDRIIPRLDASIIDATPFFFMPTFLSKVVHCATPPEDALRGAIRRLGYRVTRSHCRAGSFKTDAPWNVIWEIMREWVRQKAPIKEGAVRENTPGWKILFGEKKNQKTNAADLISETVAKLEDENCDNAEDLKAVLQGVLWKLEQSSTPRVAPETGVINGSNHDAYIEEERKFGDTQRQLAAAADDDDDRSDSRVIFDEQLGKEKPRGKLVRYQINPRANWGPMNRAVAEA